MEIKKLEKFPDDSIELTAHLTPHAWNKLADKINEIIEALNDPSRR